MPRGSQGFACTFGEGKEAACPWVDLGMVSRSGGLVRWIIADKVQ